MSNINYSYELHEFNSALQNDALVTSAPSKTTEIINDFREGEHFRTGAESGTHSLILKMEKLMLYLVVKRPLQEQQLSQLH